MNCGSLAADTSGLLGTSSTCTGTGASTLLAVLATVLAVALGVAALSSIATLGVTGFGIAMASAGCTSGRTCTCASGTGSSACLAVTGLSIAALGVTRLGVAFLTRNLDAALGGAGSVVLGIARSGAAGNAAALTMVIVGAVTATGVVFGAGGNLAAGDFA